MTQYPWLVVDTTIVVGTITIIIVFSTTIVFVVVVVLRKFSAAGVKMMKTQQLIVGCRRAPKGMQTYLK